LFDEQALDKKQIQSEFKEFKYNNYHKLEQERDYANEVAKIAEKKC